MIIAVCGYGTHGKGTSAAYICLKTGLRYKESTSEAAARVVFEELKDQYGYATKEEAWNDRHNHRDEWADTIWTYNEPDGLTLYREMLEHNDILEGVRRSSELQALKRHRVIDMAVWIDALKRKPREASSSCQVRAEDCDHVIDNNGTLDDLKINLDRLIECHILPKME